MHVREINRALSTFTIMNQFERNYQKSFSQLRNDIVSINDQDNVTITPAGQDPQL